MKAILSLALPALSLLRAVSGELLKSGTKTTGWELTFSGTW